jgi:hypothetical protein
LALLNSLQAKVAFGRHLLGIVKLHCPEWTSRNTLPAPDADFFINKYHPLIISINGFNRAGVLTRRLGTVVTINRNKPRAFFNHPD